MATQTGSIDLKAAKYAFNAADAAQTTANTANDKAVAFRGTCGTGATTQAKTVTCTNFSLAQGATVTVYNTTAQTYTSNKITLNVNSTGAKDVYVNGAVTGTSNQLLWTSGSIITYTYNGTYWYVADEPGTLYASCTTAADTVAKTTSSLSTAVVRKGTRISVLMSNANSAASPTLNVSSTGGKAIYAAGAALVANSLYNWQSGSTQSFTFDGSHWLMDDDTAKANAAVAAQTASKYISEITDAGIFVHLDGMADGEDIDASDAYGVHISDDVDIIRGGEVVASYGDNAIIGKTDKSHMRLSFNSMQLLDDDGTYVDFRDLRDVGGIAEVTETFRTDGTATRYVLKYYIEDIESVYFIGEPYDEPGVKTLIDPSEYSFGYLTDPFIEFAFTPAITEVEVTYSTDEYARSYTFGTRATGSVTGADSFSFGDRNTSSGVFSFAEGGGVNASGSYSHAEGVGTNAVGTWSHAEGHNTTANNNSSHAEGDYTTASGMDAHAEGCNTTASGIDSHAEGYGATASATCSHAEGMNTVASYTQCHAEGFGTTASGVASHSEGGGTTASGSYSHAGGRDTTASGNTSHASGYSTIAQGAYQTVIGIYNEANGSNLIRDWNHYGFIMGTGESSSSRENAIAVTWGGDVHIRLNTAAASGIDYDLNTAITTLGWASEVIV